MMKNTQKSVRQIALINAKLRDADRAKDPDYDEKSAQRPSPAYDASIELYNDGSVTNLMINHFGYRPAPDWKPRQEHKQFTSQKTGKTYVWKWDTPDDIAPALPGRSPDGGQWVEVMKKI